LVYHKNEEDSSQYQNEIYSSNPSLIVVTGRSLLQLPVGMSLSLLAIQKVQPLGLKFTVDESPSETSEELLGHLVAGRLA
jgi:hypothetical protein